MNLKEIDAKLSEITGKIDFYSHLTPVNLQEEKERFFKAVKSGKAYDPVFEYKERPDLSGEKDELLDALGVLDKTDPLARMLADKVRFVLGHINMLSSDDEAFPRLAAEDFGTPGEECMALAKDILDESKRSGYVFPDETVAPSEMAVTLQKKLNDEHINWGTTISTKIVPKITVSGRDKVIYVNSRIYYTAEEVERLKVHEVEVHIYRGVNGQTQGLNIFTEGLAGYNETEEGLALYVEEKTGVLEHDTRQMKLYAGRAFAVGHAVGESFYRTFKALQEYFPQDMAYRLTERVKRGLKDTSKAGAFTKDFHYISGLKKVRQYVDEGGDLSILYVGKIGLGDVDTVKGLLAAGKLKPPKYLPSFAKNA